MNKARIRQKSLEKRRKRIEKMEKRRKYKHRKRVKIGSCTPIPVPTWVRTVTMDRDIRLGKETEDRRTRARQNKQQAVARQGNR